MKIFVINFLFRTDSLSEDRLSEDRKILTQALVIAVFLELYSLTTLAEMFLSPGGWVLVMKSIKAKKNLFQAQRIIGMSQLVLSALNHSVHSTIFIMTNSTIRAYLPLPSKSCLLNMTIKRDRLCTVTTADKVYR